MDLLSKKKVCSGSTAMKVKNDVMSDSIRSESSAEIQVVDLGGGSATSSRTITTGTLVVSSLDPLYSRLLVNFNY